MLLGGENVASCCSLSKTKQMFDKQCLKGGLAIKHCLTIQFQMLDQQCLIVWPGPKVPCDLNVYQFLSNFLCQTIFNNSTAFLFSTFVFVFSPSVLRAIFKCHVVYPRFFCHSKVPI